MLTGIAIDGPEEGRMLSSSSRTFRTAGGRVYYLHELAFGCIVVNCWSESANTPHDRLPAVASRVKLAEAELSGTPVVALRLEVEIQGPAAIIARHRDMLESALCGWIVTFVQNDTETRQPIIDIRIGGNLSTGQKTFSIDAMMLEAYTDAEQFVRQKTHELALTVFAADLRRQGELHPKRLPTR